jgi:hypothetical protein
MAHLLVNYNRLIYCNCQGKSRNTKGSHETVCGHGKDACKSAMRAFHDERKHTLILLLMTMREKIPGESQGIQRAGMCQEGINSRHYLPKADLLFFLTRHYELDVVMWYINLGFKG